MGPDMEVTKNKGNEEGSRCHSADSDRSEDRDAADKADMDIGD
jgi:hypothetical protein